MKTIQPTITVTILPSPVHAGDWHDKPLRYVVSGPRSEQQMFSTKKNAQRYASIRRRSSDQMEAINKYQA